MRNQSYFIAYLVNFSELVLPLVYLTNKPFDMIIIKMAMFTLSSKVLFSSFLSRFDGFKIFTVFSSIDLNVNAIKVKVLKTRQAIALQQVFSVYESSKRATRHSPNLL